MKKIQLVLFLTLTLGFITQAFSVTGVALVHGTGNQSDATNDYWKQGMVDSIRQDLPNIENYVVINCDFDQYMWHPAAAGCLASQLTDFINSKGITDMVVITHSNGGNIMRWIMSNPEWDPKYQNIISTIRWVSALAPSSKGTPLADAVMQGNTFERALGWLMGYTSDAVRMQQTLWMHYYNSVWLDGTDVSKKAYLPKGFWHVVGTDVETAFWDRDSYCGGYALNIGLEITQAWLDSCSDGFLECSSQEGAGELWFRDTDQTNGSEPLNHNQSRRQCFGLDVILRDDVALGAT